MSFGKLGLCPRCGTDERGCGTWIDLTYGGPHGPIHGGRWCEAPRIELPPRQPRPKSPAEVEAERLKAIKEEASRRASAEEALRRRAVEMELRRVTHRPSLADAILLIEREYWLGDDVLRAFWRFEAVERSASADRRIAAVTRLGPFSRSDFSFETLAAWVLPQAGASGKDLWIDVAGFVWDERPDSVPAGALIARDQRSLWLRRSQLVSCSVDTGRRYRDLVLLALGRWSPLPESVRSRQAADLANPTWLAAWASYRQTANERPQWTPTNRLTRADERE